MTAARGGRASTRREELGAVVLVFKVLSRGQTTLVLALGDTSSEAVKSAMHRILSR
jgi:hypothetical protein